MKISLYALLLVTIFSTGCTRYYYKPSGVNVPALYDKGQARLTAAGMASTDGANTGNTNFFDFQAAYSPVKYLGIIANYSSWGYRTKNHNFMLGREDGRARLAELGIGGYWAYGKGNRKLVADLYAGGGRGVVRSDVDMNVTRWFIQPGVGMRSTYFDAFLNIRISNIRYRDFKDNGHDIYYLRQQDLRDQDGRFIDHRPYTFVEPCITVRGGIKPVKLQLQLVYASPTTELDWNINPVRFTMGFQFDVNEVLKLWKE